MRSSVLVGLVVLIMFTSQSFGEKSPQIRLSELSPAGAGDIYGFAYQELSVADKKIGCVHRFQRLSENFAAIWKCKLLEIEDYPRSEAPGLLEEWYIVDLKTGDLLDFKGPYFHQYQSCPSFYHDYAAYYGLLKHFPDDPVYTVYAIIFDWKHGRVAARQFLGVHGFETDAPCSIGAPKWDNDSYPPSVTFEPEDFGLEFALRPEV